MQVEASEDQALVRGVELGDAASGLEDHRVALDEATLVAQPAPFVTFLGQCLRVAGRDGQLGVDLVDVRLFARGLLRCEIVAQRVLSSTCSSCRPAGR